MSEQATENLGLFLGLETKKTRENILATANPENPKETRQSFIKYERGIRAHEDLPSEIRTRLLAECKQIITNSDTIRETMLLEHMTKLEKAIRENGNETNPIDLLCALQDLVTNIKIKEDWRDTHAKVIGKPIGNYFTFAKNANTPPPEQIGATNIEIDGYTEVLCDGAIFTNKNGNLIQLEMEHTENDTKYHLHYFEEVEKGTGNWRRGWNYQNRPKKETISFHKLKNRFHGNKDDEKTLTRGVMAIGDKEFGKNKTFFKESDTEIKNLQLLHTKNTEPNENICKGWQISANGDADKNRNSRAHYLQCITSDANQPLEINGQKIDVTAALHGKMPKFTYQNCTAYVVAQKINNQIIVTISIGAYPFNFVVKEAINHNKTEKEIKRNQNIKETMKNINILLKITKSLIKISQNTAETIQPAIKENWKTIKPENTNKIIQQLKQYSKNLKKIELPTNIHKIRNQITASITKMQNEIKNNTATSETFEQITKTLEIVTKLLNDKVIKLSKNKPL